MADAGVDYPSWDSEDQGIVLDVLPQDEKNGEDDDDVFLARDEIDGNFQKISDIKPKPVRKKLNKPSPVSPPRSPCSAQWSVSHRCIDCAWKTQRGGRPHHPPPPITMGPASPPLVTLQSLGTTRDSGYEPSPTSAFSFSFTSDDDDTEVEDSPKDDLLVVEDPIVASGLTPPINIPLGGLGNDWRKSRSAKSGEKYWVLDDSEAKEPAPTSATGKRINKESQLHRKRSKSVPELWANEPVLPRTPIVIRSDDFRKSAKPTPIHGRNYSLPATTPDGRPMFAATPPTPGSRASRERLIDLTEEDPEGSSGHHRRVLVLALPDLLVDLDYLKRSGTPLSSSSSLLSPSGKSSSSSTSTTSKDTHYSSPAGSSKYLAPLKSALSFGRSHSTSSTPSSASSETADVVVNHRSRPTWRRPRALSCDVTLEVEFGQELRRAADNFSRNNNNGWEGGMWRKLRDSFGRRFSLGSCPPLQERNVEQEEQNVAHSLPVTSSVYSD